MRVDDVWAGRGRERCGGRVWCVMICVVCFSRVSAVFCEHSSVRERERERDMQAARFWNHSVLLL